uniref:Rothein 4.1 n=1 Tax=Litoria rothii TaxID=336074 RepID=ROT41_LITRO|nr:RecName: Full=Rothein 4.1 [Litoria rothii]
AEILFGDVRPPWMPPPIFPEMP